MKSYQGNYYLSGNTACRWYFNPAIPEANPLYESYRNQRLEIRSVASPVQQRIQSRAEAQLEEKNLRELNELSPYEFAENGYRCTVTIGRLVPNASWWFPSCNRCSKSCVPDGAGYRCLPCGNNSFKFKYKVCFVALDGTDEAEMICFGDVARRIIGKPVQQLLRASAGPNEYPADITKLVSLRFTFAVTMARQSYYKPKKTYNVAALVTAHGHPAALAGNPAHSNPGGGNGDHDIADGSDDSSNKGHSENTLGTSTPPTPRSALSSPDLTMTPPPNLDGLETPTSKKQKRGGPSTANKKPSARRKLVLSDEHDDAADGEGAKNKSAEAGKPQASEDERSSPERVAAHLSG